MKKYTFEARANEYGDDIQIDPIRVSCGSLWFSRGSVMQKTLHLKDEERVKVTIERA